MLRKTATALLISVGLAACNPTGDKTLSQSDSVEKTAIVRDTTTAVASGDNSQNALDWAGTYEATLPCADCPGIKTTLTLIQDNTFTISSTYLEDKTRSTVTEDKGTITWIKNGSIIRLKGRDTDVLLKVGENLLIQLDKQGKEIEGPLRDQYIFTKK
jgi:uncharacterized lipoprotein NlpE involved in copper resistance